MARYNEILVGRFNRSLQKLTQLKGDAPAPQLASEIVPSVVFPLGAEFRYLDSWDRFGVRVFQAAVAAQFGFIRIRNPGGSNVVSVLEKITLTNTLADSPLIQLNAQAADLATAFAPTVGRLDNRGRANPTLSLSTTTSASALTGTLTWGGTFPANGTLEVIVFEEQEIPLLPGDAVTVQGGTLNQSVVTTFFWRERFLEESERT